MKKNVLISTFAFFCISSIFSQDWFTGGNISFQYNAFDGATVELSPEIGYKINNKFDLGLNPLFRYYDETAIFGIGFFTRYSFFEINKFSILGRIELIYLNIDNEINALGIDIRPIFQYRLLDKFSLYTSVGSISYSRIFGIGNNFGLNFSTNVSLGFYILFGSTRKNKIESSEEIEDGNENDE